MRWRWPPCWRSRGSDVVLSGAATVEQVRSNLGALSVQWDAAADAALRDIVEEPDDLLGSARRDAVELING